MVAADLGFRPLGGLEVVVILLKMFLLLFIPGYFISLALFPKKNDLSVDERVLLSFVFGMIPSFLLFLLSALAGVKLNFVTDLVMFLLSTVVGLAGYFYRRGDASFLSRWVKLNYSE